MWDWLRLRRRSHRAPQPDHSDPTLTAQNQRNEGIDRLLRSSYNRPLLFTPRPAIAAFPPKCISRLPCSQILYGERLEDFSSDCWLENHLHRFGFPDSNETNTENVNIPFEESLDDSTTGTDTVSSGYTVSDFDYPITSDISQPQPRLALEELFIPMNGENHTESSTDFHEVEMPPPYSPFEEPPPTYEEAVGSFERRSSGSISSSSIAFMW